jgi:hypothetical protein
VEKIWDILTDIFVEILGFVYDTTEIASQIDWFESSGPRGYSLFEGAIMILVCIGSFYLFRKDENVAGYPEEEAKLIRKRLKRLGIVASILVITWVILLQVIKFLVGDD